MDGDKVYKSLEQQIRELWASRGLEVVQERFRALKHGRFEWRIIAKQKRGSHGKT